MTKLTTLSDKKLGILALAAAGERGWFFGHVGAGLLALDALKETHTIEELTPALDVYREKSLKFIEANGRTSWLESSGPIIEGWRGLLGDLAEPLFQELRNSGHGTIYFMWAARVFFSAPELATHDVLSGLGDLFKAALVNDDKRYYGIADHSQEKITALPENFTADALIKRTLLNAVPTLKDAKGGERTWFFSGSKIHILTYLHAALELGRLGYTDWSQKGLELWHRHETLYGKMLANAERDFNEQGFEAMGDLKPKTDFFTTIYQDPHAYKYLAATEDLLKLYGYKETDKLRAPILKTLNVFS
ncbi:hypothetical protein [Kiloniella antarctica]|uniref:Uncharacterized protein n=1 Tax=Kiloniella antarctica TaxID=1550907 RepID=A0ABW5BK04_9PROT